MAESRLVPSNLMSWPAIRDLLPDQKLIVYHLWATCPSAAGCWLLDVVACAAALSLSRSALDQALADFEHRQLVALDKKTGEIFICAWFRWHKFDNAIRRGVLEAAIDRVESRTLLGIVEKSSACIPREEKASKEKGSKDKRSEGKSLPAGTRLRSVAEPDLTLLVTPDGNATTLRCGFPAGLSLSANEVSKGLEEGRYEIVADYEDGVAA